MGYRKWKRGFRVPVRRQSRLRRLGDLILFCTLAFGSIYAIARYLPDREVEGAARVIDGDSPDGQRRGGAPAQHRCA